MPSDAGRFGLPIALDLAGRRAVVVGGGVVGEDRVRTLLEAGAEVTAIAERFTPGLHELAKRGDLVLLHRAYAPGDLEGAFLAVAATNSPHVNTRIHAEADELRVLLHSVDDPEHCHFSFPSVLRRAELQVAVSTGGRAPALATWLRKKLSRTVGAEYGELVEVLDGVEQSLRPAAPAKEALATETATPPPTGAPGDGAATRERRWEQAIDEDLAGLVRRGRIDEAAARVRARVSARGPQEGPSGSVAIVGAGPGDGGLLTERARRLIEEADVVVFDRLVSPDLVEGKHAVYVGKEPGPNPGRRGPSQAEINMLLVLFARQGKRVVRLKGGDPFVFGRGAEEAEALAAAGIEFEIVPAPSSAIAALAYAGIPVTDRRFSSSVAIVTGQSATGQSATGQSATGQTATGQSATGQSATGHSGTVQTATGDGPGREVNWRALATATDTIVVLMGVGTLGHIVNELIIGGLDPATPSAVVEHGTTPQQRVVTAPVAELPERARMAGMGTPSVIVVGEVVRLRDRIRWFDRDPEAQAVTRPGSAREGQPT